MSKEFAYRYRLREIIGLYMTVGHKVKDRVLVDFELF